MNIQVLMQFSILSILAKLDFFFLKSGLQNVPPNIIQFGVMEIYG